MNPFHPLVAGWFAETFGEPTPGQQKGWQAIASGQHTLIAAPTGSGKTLGAFLTTLDGLFREGLRGPLADEVRVVYVSPLKALSTDIHKNLAVPRRGIARCAETMEMNPPVSRPRCEPATPLRPSVPPCFERRRIFWSRRRNRCSCC